MTANDQSALRKTPEARFGAIIVLALGLLVTGCGGGGGGSSTAPAASAAPATPTVAEQGELVITITDAPGDFVMYEVDVTALTLTRQNGDVVSALPLSTRIDFAELTEVTELLSIATVPAGNYESVVVSLDFSAAEILVQNAAGDAVAAAPQDSLGDPLGVIDTRLQLTTSDLIRIAPGRPAAFSLDFDLDASNSIDLAADPVSVTVEPLLLATPELELDRVHRVRGLLLAVDEADSSFELAVRPFRHRSGRFGEFTVQTSDATGYAVDGVEFVGAEGLMAMSFLAERSAVIARGRIESIDNSRTFVAEEVVAGTSVPGADGNTVRGVIVARSNNSVTVRGAQVDFADGAHAFRGEFTVQFDTDTVVTAALDAMAGTDSLSVGQPLWAWGELADDNTLAASRIRLTQASFTATVLEESPLVVDLFLLNGRRPVIYDFTGTGVSADSDADPANYEVDSALQLPGTLEAGGLVRIRGRVNEFGMAAPDFLARTIIDVASDTRAATLRVGWDEPVPTPFLSTSADRIDVDLSAARKALKLRGVRNGSIDLMSDIALVAPDGGMGVYAVRLRGAGEQALYRNFSELVRALNEQIDAGASLHRITAQGGYNSQSTELVTRRAGFVFSAGQADG